MAGDERASQQVLVIAEWKAQQVLLIADTCNTRLLVSITCIICIHVLHAAFSPRTLMLVVKTTTNR